MAVYHAMCRLVDFFCCFVYYLLATNTVFFVAVVESQDVSLYCRTPNCYRDRRNVFWLFQTIKSDCVLNGVDVVINCTKYIPGDGARGTPTRTVEYTSTKNLCARLIVRILHKTYVLVRF